MSTIDWGKLTAPVPAEDIEWVEKAAGKKFAYMSAQFVRRRLDAVVLGLWNYTCEPVLFTEGQPPASDGEPFVVIGTVGIYGEGVSVTRSSIGSGKNYKEAETDAFKRAAQRLGIGNELYEMGPGHVDAITQRVVKAAPQGLTAADKAVMIEAATKPAIVRAGPAAGALACPTCAGVMWDNRPKKESGAFKPNAPDWSCKDKACGGKWWKDADGRKPAEPEPVTVASISGAMQDDDDKLPF